MIIYHLNAVPDLAQKGRVWSERVANERIYHKYSDVDLARRARGLEYAHENETGVASVRDLVN